MGLVVRAQGREVREKSPPSWEELSRNFPPADGQVWPASSEPAGCHADSFLQGRLAPLSQLGAGQGGYRVREEPQQVPRFPRGSECQQHPKRPRWAGPTAPGSMAPAPSTAPGRDLKSASLSPGLPEQTWAEQPPWLRLRPGPQGTKPVSGLCGTTSHWVTLPKAVSPPSAAVRTLPELSLLLATPQDGGPVWVLPLPG